MASQVAFPLLFFLLFSAVQSTCVKESSVPDQGSIPHCLRRAAERHATSVIVKANDGICVFCGTKKPRGESCLTYKREEKQHASFLLMRTTAESNVSVIDLFLSNSTNKSVMEPQDLKGTTAPFKSPLFYSGGLMSVIVEFLLSNGSTAVRLKFSFRGKDLRTEQNWFRPKFLLEAFPWNVNRMKSDRYNRFKIDVGNRIRYFYINKMYERCFKDQGYMVITNGTGCRWDKKRSHSYGYLWTPLADTHNNTWRYTSQEANEFRIFGEYVLEPGDRMYRLIY